MRRATITIPDDLEAQVNAYLEAQEPPPSLTGLVQAALRRYLREHRLKQRQFQPPRRTLRITPAPEGSGMGDVSVEHDRELAESQ